MRKHRNLPSEARRIVLIDATGRGHALTDCLTRTDPNVIVFYAPGTALTAAPRIVPVPDADLTDPEHLANLCERIGADLVVVSHTDALTRGAVEVIRARGIPTVGPTAATVRLESSKSAMKAFCNRHDLPTADWCAFDDREVAKSYARRAKYPLVVKADGLCACGDGAVVCDNREGALGAIDRLSNQEFYGEAGQRIILEEFLEGQELSLFALLTGETATIFPTAMDYKRRYDRGRGPNCDGMGSVSPHPLETPGLIRTLEHRIVRPFLAGLRRDALDYRGFVYFGLILTTRGPKILEINVRFGDSEAEAVFPRILSPLSPMLAHAAVGRPILDKPSVSGMVCVSVALIQGPVPGEAGSGWPDGATAGSQEISGLRRAQAPDCRLYIANIDIGRNGRPISGGGRVLHTTGLGSDFETARRAAYRAALLIQFNGKSLRTDIARGLQDLASRSVESSLRERSMRPAANSSLASARSGGIENATAQIIGHELGG